MFNSIVCVGCSKVKPPHLSHEDLGSLDEHGGAGDVKALLQAVQTELLHLLIAALHLHRVERQHGDLLHVLDGREKRWIMKIRWRWYFVYHRLEMWDSLRVTLDRKVWSVTK